VAETQAIAPPEGYSPDLKRGLAWCPYCGRETPFAYDFRLNYARCSGCGISERDFYVRQFNSFWDQADRRIGAFVHAVKRSGRKYKKPFFWEEQNQEMETNKKPCNRCGELFTPASNHHLHCPKCAAKAKREAARNRKRRQRERQKVAGC